MFLVIYIFFIYRCLVNVQYNSIIFTVHFVLNLYQLGTCSCSEGGLCLWMMKGKSDGIMDHFT